jgi:hypothetical protein
LPGSAPRGDSLPGDTSDGLRERVSDILREIGEKA